MPPGPAPYSESVKGKAEIKRKEKMVAKQQKLKEAVEAQEAKEAKKASKSKGPQEKGWVSPDEHIEEVKADLRGKQSLYITSMKNKQKNNTITGDEKVVLDLYNSLARMSDEKGVLVQKWLQDRSCQWATTYMAQKQSKKVTASSSVSGFGTKFEP